jgi:anti-sigma factor RsiW
MTKHIADNHDALLDYLYEEGEPAERLKIAQHLQECAPCSVAVLEFQNVRGMLRDWTPPPADLGFRVVRDGEGMTPVADVPPATRRAWWAWSPLTHQSRWAQAAAAVLLFALGMAVSQVRMRYSDGAVTLQVLPPQAGPMPVSQNARRASIDLQAEAPAQFDNGPVRPLVTSTAPQSAANVDVERLLQRVRAMIDQSEQRQQRELALRLSQTATEVETQHQADLLRIQQSLGQQQDDVMNYLVRTSGGPK